MMSAVKDGTEYVDEAGLYLLLEHVSANGKRAPEVSWEDLLDRPGTYRGHWVRLAARIMETKVHRLSNVNRWPDPVFVSVLLDEAEQRAVSFIGIEGFALSRNTPVWVEGFFFKIRRDSARGTTQPGEGEEILVPVIVGRALVARNPWKGGKPAHFPLLVTVCVVVGLLVAYLYARRKTRARADRIRTVRPASVEGDRYETAPIDLDTFEPADANSEFGWRTDSADPAEPANDDDQ